MTQPKPPLKVGFDLDGVLLYNPSRLARPLISWFKKTVLKKTHAKFHIPKTPIEKTIWTLLHKSSIFISPGYQDIKRLVKAGKIDAYLITARYSFLKKDLDKWLNKMHANDTFKQIYYNEHDEQPHLYKEKLIKQLKLDAFIDDNWDIVEYLHKLKLKNAHNTPTYWVYNFLDRHIAYPHKFPSVSHFIKHLEAKIAR